MATHFKASERLHTDLGWLDSHHTFSFGGHYDPSRMGYRALRVINDDTVQPGRGFGTHPHQDMEILSYVLEGELAHSDSMGTGSVIRPGEVQRMSAGTGVTHSEQNPSKTEPVHFLQIWILPKARGVTPSYAQREFPEQERRGSLRLVVSPDGRDGSISINQDTDLYAGLLTEGEALTHVPKRGHTFVHVAQGALRVGGVELGAGDGLAIDGHTPLHLEGVSGADVLVFDLG